MRAMSIRLSELIKLVLSRCEVVELLRKHNVDLSRYQSIILEDADIEIRTFQEFLDNYNDVFARVYGRLDDLERRVLIEQKPLIVSLVYNLFNTIT